MWDLQYSPNLFFCWMLMISDYLLCSFLCSGVVTYSIIYHGFLLKYRRQPLYLGYPLRTSSTNYDIRWCLPEMLFNNFSSSTTFLQPDSLYRQERVCHKIEFIFAIYIGFQLKRLNNCMMLEAFQKMEPIFKWWIQRALSTVLHFTCISVTHMFCCISPYWVYLLPVHSIHFTHLDHLQKLTSPKAGFCS